MASKTAKIKEPEFIHRRVNSRTDLIDFVERNLDKDVRAKIGSDPKRWIEELSIIKQFLTGEGLTSMQGLYMPPVDDNDFVQLGDNTFIYSGENRRLRGLWTRNPGYDMPGRSESAFNWIQYNMGAGADLAINKEYSDFPTELFLPENFEKNGKKVKKEKGSDKRPIYKVKISSGEKEAAIYAKGAYSAFSYFYDKPSYRLTNMAGISRVSSAKERDMTLELGRIGINVPSVVGFYNSLSEEFVFLESIEGKQPNASFSEHREEIIRQDAQMLAMLCMAGYRKLGFTDFDDKIFDGENLYLIDVEECTDIYFPAKPDYKKMLINPKEAGKIREFRNYQREIFTRELRDALYNYRETLTPNEDEKAAYVRAFYNKMEWKEPDDAKIGKIVSFPKDYSTFDSYLSFMSDTD